MQDCINCGQPVDQRELACPHCGQPILQRLPRLENKRGFGRNRQRQRNIALTVISSSLAVAVAAVLISALINWYASQTEHERLAVEADLAPRRIAVSIALPEYNALASSKIALQVKGRERGGSMVNETFFVTAEGGFFEIKQGRYTMALLGSPLNDDGVLYRAFYDEVAFEVGENGLTVSFAPESFTLLSPEQITDTELQKACDLARASGWGEERVEAARAATQAKRDEIAAAAAEAQRLEAEAAAAAAAAEAAERQQALTIATPYYTIVLGDTYYQRYTFAYAESLTNWASAKNTAYAVTSITTGDPFLNFEVALLRTDDSGALEGAPAASVYSYQIVGTLSSDPNFKVVIIRYRAFEAGADPGKLGVYASYVWIR